MPFTDISEQNSTVSPLGAGETFTGRGEIHDLPDMMVVCKTDGAGVLYVDFSTDEGANWDSTLSFNVAANSNEFHTLVKGRRVTRVRYVNGATPQTYMRLQTTFGTFRQGNLPLKATIAQDSDATVVRSVPTDLDLAFGRVAGQLEDAKFGYVPTANTASTDFDMWHFADAAGSPRSSEKFWPTSGGTLYMASNSASDTAVDLEVSYLDDAGASQSLSYTYTAGTAGASLGVSGLDITRVRVTGPSAGAVGNLYFAQTNTWTSGDPTTPGDVIAYIPAGYNQTQQCMATVPLGKKARIKQIVSRMSRASGAAGSGSVQLKTRAPGGPWVVKRDYPLTTAFGVSERAAGLVLDALTQFKLYIEDCSDNGTTIYGEIIFDEVET